MASRITRAEVELLEREFVSPQVQVWLASGRPGCVRQAANHIIQQYVSELGDPLPAESDADFEARKATLKTQLARSRLVCRPTETDQDYNSRLAGIPNFIYNWVKFRVQRDVSRAPQ